MAFTTQLKAYINSILQSANLRLDTLTIHRAEYDRLMKLKRAGRFTEPVFRLPPALQGMNAWVALEEIERHADRFRKFCTPEANDVGYSFDNPWYTSPDTEVLYALVQHFKPRTILEVGCGNSSRIIRQAILDGQLDSRLICIDPSPRLDVSSCADEFLRHPVEQLSTDQITTRLAHNDILFIDSSHILSTGGDVAFLYLDVLPNLQPGVLIHIHDVFLPYDYPSDWVIGDGWGFNEQYLLQCILQFSNAFEVLWAGYYLQQTRPDFARWFPHIGARRAQSFWMRKQS